MAPIMKQPTLVNRRSLWSPREMASLNTVKRPVGKTPLPKSPVISPPATGTSGARDKQDLAGWSVILLVDETTGKRTYEFSCPNGRGGVTQSEHSVALSMPQLVRDLRCYGDLPDKLESAATALRKLVAAASNSVVIKATQPGWKRSETGSQKPTAFVLPHTTIPPTSNYRWGAASNNRLGLSRGSHEAWDKGIAQFSRYSDPLAFSICASLAAPLVRFAGLTESVVFNFVGPSSVGKSRVMTAAQTTIAPPDAIQSWDFKNRALEEAAAQRNDCLLVMNGAERLTKVELRQFITKVVHMLPEGVGMMRSSAVGETLPNLEWKNLILSSSNLTGREMAGPHSNWDDQENVRFIDIPVNESGKGGIFDRLKPGPDIAARASKLVHTLDELLANNYGTIWPRYITHLLTIDIAAVVATYIRAYLDHTKPTPGVEERIARKFGLCYAAGMIAQGAGLLSWEVARVLNSVRKMHLASMRLRGRASDNVMTALADIRRKRVFPHVRDLSKNKSVIIIDSAEWLGIQTRYKNRVVLGFRREELIGRYGNQATDALISWFKSNNLLVGNGSDGTQIRVHLTVDGRTVEKPRFVLVDYEEFAIELESLRSFVAGKTY